MVLGVAITAFADTRARKYTLLILGILIFVVAAIWPSLANRAPQLAATARNIAGDFRVWLAVFLLAWLYAGVSQIVLMIQRDRYAEIVQKDMLPFRIALERWVLPRRLTPEQITSISAHLSNHPSYPVAFRVSRNDDEAGEYRGDLYRAITGGGWIVVPAVDYTDDIRAGLTIHFHQSTASQQVPDDPRNPKPDRIVNEALKNAGVRVDGSGGGSGAADLLTIHVGPRRRDTYGHKQKWWPS